MTSRDDYHDTREDLPIRLIRKYADYDIRIHAEEDSAFGSTGRFVWSITKPGTSVHAQGVAPTIDMAREIVERVLDVYAIRIRTVEEHGVSGAGRPVIVR